MHWTQYRGGRREWVVGGQADPKMLFLCMVNVALCDTCETRLSCQGRGWRGQGCVIDIARVQNKYHEKSSRSVEYHHKFYDVMICGAPCCMVGERRMALPQGKVRRGRISNMGYPCQCKVCWALLKLDVEFCKGARQSYLVSV